MASREFSYAEVYNGIVTRRKFVVDVGKQLEMEPFRGAELSVRKFILAADAENDGVLLFVLRKVVLEVVSLSRATAGEILGVKIQDNPLATEIVKADWLPILSV